MTATNGNTHKIVRKIWMNTFCMMCIHKGHTKYVAFLLPNARPYGDNVSALAVSVLDSCHSYMIYKYTYAHKYDESENVAYR